MTEEIEGDPLRASMIAARVRPAVIKTRFIAFRSAYPIGLVFAVEGPDDKIVYSHWIRRLDGDLAYEFFVCGGKRGARQLKNALQRDVDELGDAVLFLVDRDFDDLRGFAGAAGVYMLDTYSIENVLVDRGVLDECLKVAFPCEGEAGIRDAICSLFDKAYAEFLSATKAVNRRIFIARRLGYDIDDQIVFGVSQMAIVELGEVKPTDVQPEALITLDPEPEQADVDTLSADFDALDPPTRYRGKFALKFFFTWLEKLGSEYRIPQLGLFGGLGDGGARIRHDELCLGSFASKANVPASFAEFLHRETHH